MKKKRSIDKIMVSDVKLSLSLVKRDIEKALKNENDYDVRRGLERLLDAITRSRDDIRRNCQSE